MATPVAAPQPNGPATPATPAVPATPATPATPAAPAKSLFPALPGMTPPAPAEQPAPAQPDVRSEFFNPQPAQPAAPAQTPATPGQPAALNPEAPDFDPRAFVEDFVRGLIPEGALDANNPASKNLAPLRQAMVDATNRALAAELKLARAHKAGKSVADQATLDKLAAAEAQVSEWKPKLEKLSTLEARAELLDNDAFNNEFTGKLANLRSEIEGTVKEFGLEAELAEKLLGAETVPAAMKLLSGVQDSSAKEFLLGLARQAVTATREFKANWKDPVKALETWRAKNAERGAQATAGNVAQAVAMHKQAIAAAVAGDPATGAPPNYVLAALMSSPEGQAQLASLEAQYAGNAPIPPGQIFQDRVQAATVPHLLNYTAHLEGEVQKLRAAVAAYKGVQPSGLAPVGPQGGGQQASRFFQMPAVGGPVVGTPVGAGAPIIPGAVAGMASRA